MLWLTIVETPTLNPIVSKYVDYVNKQIQYLNKIPYIEQKTEEWFKIRKNMISASVCGYIDSKECGIGLSKETEQILTKTDLQEKKKFYWGGPTKHGQIYEDLSGDFYDTFNGLTSKEYGICIYNSWESGRFSHDMKETTSIKT